MCIPAAGRGENRGETQCLGKRRNPGKTAAAVLRLLLKQRI